MEFIESCRITVMPEKNKEIEKLKSDLHDAKLTMVQQIEEK